MSQLLPCPACNRHLDAAEAACPFCGAVLPESFREARPPALPPRRLSRAALMAAGATLAAACSSTGPAPMPAYGGPSPGTGSGGASATGGSTEATGGNPGNGGTTGSGGEPERDAGQDRSIAPFYGAPLPAGSAGPTEPPR